MWITYNNVSHVDKGMYYRIISAIELLIIV